MASSASGSRLTYTVTTRSVIFLWGHPHSRAIPKSASFSCPSLASSKLFGLRSYLWSEGHWYFHRCVVIDGMHTLWRIPLRWQWLIPRKVITIQLFISAALKATLLFLITISRSASKYSSTRLRLVLCANTSISWHMASRLNRVSGTLWVAWFSPQRHLDVVVLAAT